MDATAGEWLHLIVRWFHVYVGILWIGSTYFFTWLDSALLPREGAEGHIVGEVWMVHSGGFYMMEKQKFVPGRIPKILHWFKWEATFTALSGLFLLVLVYYMGGALVAPESAIPEGTARLIGIGSIVGGWFVYDLLWRSPIGKNERVGAIISFGLLVALAYVLTHTLSARAAYMHVGATMGVIMATNVWVHILPAQRRALATIAKGEVPDPAPALRAKQRSKQNTFMTLPVVFIMISNHFPTVFADQWNWLILGGLILLGWGARALLIRERH